MMARSSTPSSAPGAVVIGGDFQGLGIARSLGMRGIPVCVVDDTLAISRWSRYCTHHVRVADLRDEAKTVDSLLKVGQALHLDGWVLYPTRDETVAALSRHRDQLGRQFRVPTPPWDVIEVAWDKRSTYQTCQELGIAAPRTWLPKSVADLEAVDCDPPWVVKPAIKEHFVYTTKAKAWMAADRHRLRELFEKAQRLVPEAEIMVQELIPGGSERVYGYCTLFKDRTSIASMVAQYRRQHPPVFGRSCTAVQTVDCPQVEELAVRLLSAINYYGLTEIEFKLDPRDGCYKLLDLNARTWGYNSLGSAAGIDFPFLLFEDQCEREVRSCRGRTGVTWLRLITDVPAGLIDVLRRRSSFIDYCKSIAGFDIDAVYSWKDPLPGVVETLLLPYFAYKKGVSFALP